VKRPFGPRGPKGDSRQVLLSNSTGVSGGIPRENVVTIPLPHPIFYESIARLHLVPEIGKIRLQKLTPERVQSLLNTKLEQGLSPRMVRHIRTTLITALQQQVDRGNLPRNVASLADPPRLPENGNPVL